MYIDERDLNSQSNESLQRRCRSSSTSTESWVLRTWFPSAWNWRSWPRVYPLILTPLCRPAQWLRSPALRSHQVRINIWWPTFVVSPNVGEAFTLRRTFWKRKEWVFFFFFKSLFLDFRKNGISPGHRWRQRDKWAREQEINRARSESFSFLSANRPFHFHLLLLSCMSSHGSSHFNHAPLPQRALLSNLDTVSTYPSVLLLLSSLSCCCPVAFSSLRRPPVPIQHLYLRRRLTATRARRAPKRKLEKRGAEPSPPPQRRSHLPTKRSRLWNKQSCHLVKTRPKVSAFGWFVCIFSHRMFFGLGHFFFVSHPQWSPAKKRGGRPRRETQILLWQNLKTRKTSQVYESLE